MCECSRCKKLVEESDLTWVEQPSEYSPEIVWTGRGRDLSEEKKMEVICSDCLKKEKRADP